MRWSGPMEAPKRRTTSSPPEGRHHTFSRFGAGTLAPSGPVPTHLSRFMVLDPFALASEAAHLASLGVVDALVITHADAPARLGHGLKWCTGYRSQEGKRCGSLRGTHPIWSDRPRSHGG